MYSVFAKSLFFLLKIVIITFKNANCFKTCHWKIEIEPRNRKITYSCAILFPINSYEINAKSKGI